MDFLFVSLVAFFGISAAQDYTKREVQDWVTILAWAVSIGLFNMDWFVAAFVVSWAVAETVHHFFKATLLSWGDVLWLPPFFCLMMGQIGLTGAVIMALFAILAAQGMLWYQLEHLRIDKKKVRGSPFVLVMFLMLMATLAFRVFF